jgi:hypothetical protein
MAGEALATDGFFTSPTVAGPSGGLTYRMRGYDDTLATIVYWTASVDDPTGAEYGGPGPLSDVVVSKVLGT